MASHLHFDCFNGISGDMTIGALVDLGVEIEELQRRLQGLPIGPFRLRAEPLKRAGIKCTRVHVEVDERADAHVHLRHVIEKVEAAGLGATATRRAVAAYRLLAEAEARVHGSTPERIHFHEVGAKDAVVDIAGAMVGVELLGATSFSAGPVAVGQGAVVCSHGLMPVPAPATAELLKGLPTRTTEIEAELTTPTGATILRTLLEEAPAPADGLAATAIGYGAGARDIPGHPNCLRLVLGERPGVAAELPVDVEAILSLETEMDDLSPEVAGYLMERLLAAGALDVQLADVQMKKNRPGLRLKVLCAPEAGQRLAEIIFRESSTFGVRWLPGQRLCLRRRMETVATPAGEVAVKVGLWGEATLKAAPEYESCRRLAQATGRPLREIYDLAREAIQNQDDAREKEA